jgi:hypothetical protein
MPLNSIMQTRLQVAFKASPYPSQWRVSAVRKQIRRAQSQTLQVMGFDVLSTARPGPLTNQQKKCSVSSLRRPRRSIESGVPLPHALRDTPIVLDQPDRNPRRQRLTDTILRPLAGLDRTMQRDAQARR